MDTFRIKKGDTVSAIEATMQFANGSPVDLTGATIDFVMGNLSDYSFYSSGAAEITGSTTGNVKYVWNATNDTGSVGTFWGEFEADWGSGSVMTLPGDHSLKIQVYEDYK